MAPSDIVEFSSPEAKHKRKQEFQDWLDLYCEFYLEVKGIALVHEDNAAGVINALYWDTLDGNIRRNMEPGHGDNGHTTIDRHKIISLTEICIAHCQPFKLDDISEQRILNAEFAYFVARTILVSWWKDGDEHEITTTVMGESFDQEHVTWLANLMHGERLPVFSNAATWYLYEQLCFERSARLKRD